MRSRGLKCCAAVVALLLGCRAASPASPPLRPDERALVDLYVRISVVEARRATDPDSVGPALDRLAATADSLVVQRALQGLRQEPERWQYVLDAIAKRLHELEEQPVPVTLPGKPPVSGPAPARRP